MTIKTMNCKPEITKIFGINYKVWPYLVGFIFFIITLFFAPIYLSDLFETRYVNKSYKLNKLYAPVTNNQSLILAGDGGKIRSSVIEAMKSVVSTSSDNYPIIYLGDNIYPNGIPAESKKEEWQLAYTRLMRQIDPLKGITNRIYFIPGNHDWDWHQADGWEAMKRQTKIVEESLGKGHMIPANGCPGPEKLMLFEDLQIISFDTQWWLHEHIKPSTAADGCETYTNDMVLQKLDDILKDTPKGVETIFITHHPLVSYGSHGVGNDCTSDIGCPAYSDMRDKLFAVLDRHKPLICASGHDHNLQIINDHPGCRYYMVSGSTSNFTEIKTKSGRGILYALESLGFLILERLQTGRWGVRAISVVPGNWFGSASSQEEYSKQLN